ncbi:hypothetical protein BTO05_13250 [Winogradskyella sp. PC-19]|uniref:DUF4870 domain-containing protein n=1 Tax=unclassified Winogradskyella TaxID=2615021 RepID=UPI000B3D1B43|nr:MULTISPECIES: DUF4870 domain-containing protein [unclassified Winogradskyella]ARV10552.1 hypothetical protein BTO05_13250 [Winogradskyella sp. PC-19]RZN82285.1 MAG: DUF4870 domain-containing protein [Winogradskyella sp.]
MTTDHHKNIATFIHLSTFSRFLIPFGNFIGPIVLWQVNKEKSDFVDKHGKQAINFQISVLLYALIIGTISIPFFIFKVFNGIDFINFSGFYDFHINIGKPSPLLYITGGLGVLAFLGFLIELALIVKASLSARDGKEFQYPLTIKFLK